MADALRLSFPHAGIALVEFDVPGKSVNVLSRDVLTQLSTLLDTLDDRHDLRGVIFASAKPTGFLAGADVDEFSRSLDDGTTNQATTDALAASRYGQALFQRLSALPCPTVAAIEGVCLGGGAEFASWCDLRVMSNRESTQFGFPEVKLGLIPGWGGTVRLPRLIGLGNAVELITSGEPISAERAYELGLSWNTFTPGNAIAAACEAIADAQAANRFQQIRAARAEPLPPSATEIAFLGGTSSALLQRELHGHYPAPLVALEQILEAATLNVAEGLVRESEQFRELFGSPINRALLNVFQVQQRAKKTISHGTSVAAKVEKVGVIGAGIMGAGIVAAAVKRSVAAVLVDMSPSALEKGVRDITEQVSYRKPGDRRERDPVAILSAKLRSSTELESLASCDLVIEAIVEEKSKKQQLYALLEAIASPTTVIASNTSTIPITKLAETLQHAERFCGIHFFNPVRRMKLVEVIRGERTNATTIATAVDYAKQIGKFTIVVKDSPGFVVNRLLSPYLNAAIALIHDGVSLERIDRAATTFGMPLGPIALYDLVGIDTAFYAGRTMYEAFPDRFHASPLLPALLKAGRLGQKNGLGFYNYQNKRAQAHADPAVAKIVETYTKHQLNLSDEQITLRLFLPMLFEATRVLEEGVVNDPRDIDLGLIYGLGFPPFKGGLLYWADRQGAAKFLEWCAIAQSPKQCSPTTMLREMAQQSSTFYSSPATTHLQDQL